MFDRGASGGEKGKAGITLLGKRREAGHGIGQAAEGKTAKKREMRRLVTRGEREMTWR